jgi:hypothetical protein
VPAEGATRRALIGGPVEESFFAEFHTLIHDSGLARVPWACWYALPSEEESTAKTIASRRATHDRHSGASPVLSNNSFLDRRLKEDLYYDLARASFGGATTAVDALHAPILAAHAGAARDIENAVSALSVWVPNFACIPWKDILALHDHDAVGFFREELTKAHEIIGPLEEPERSLALKELQVQHLGDRLRRLEPTMKKLGADFIVNLLLDLVPIPGAGALFDATTGYAEYEDQRTHWTAVLLRLQGAVASLE